MTAICHCGKVFPYSQLDVVAVTAAVGTCAIILAARKLQLSSKPTRGSELHTRTLGKS